MFKNKYNYFYLFWLIPLFLLGLTLHQAAVYQGIRTTYQEGTSYTAEVLKFETMQIVTQTSSYVVIRFETDDGRQIRRKLTLPVEITGIVSESEILPIRYDPDSFQDIIIIAAYGDHISMTMINIAMAAFAFIATSLIGWGINRWIQSKTNDPSPRKLIIDNIKTADS